jgi:CRISPR system Cascade subunit CasD
VLGIVAACMGIPRRDRRLLELAGARVHVRVDCAGTPLVDDQTIQDNPNASPTRQTIQSKRTYLCDSSFTAIVVPGSSLPPETLATALRRPAFGPFLGRRACVPSSPLLLSPHVEASDALGLFAALPLGPTELIERVGAPDPVHYYLDLDEHPRALRSLRVRDDLSGPLPRQWKERVVLHVAAALGGQA